MKYLLPCSCGKTVTIEASQAGSRVQCACGNLVNVPAMRLIRQLPPAPMTAPAKAARSTQSWSLGRRLLFATGLTVAVGGLLTAAFFQFVRTGLDTDERQVDDVVQFQRDIDQMGVVNTWELWKIVREEQIGPYTPPQYIQSRFWSETWLRAVVGGLSAVVIGLVLVAVACLLGSKSRPEAAERVAPK